MVELAEKIFKYTVALPVAVGVYSWFALGFLDVIGLEGTKTFLRIIWGL